MILSLTNSQEVESLRRQSAKQLEADLGADWAGQYQPGTQGCHELLDRVHLLAELVEQRIQEHPACVAKPDWYALAESAAASLQQLYQLVGKDHLSSS